ncbi:ABC transporter ATP-binding protein [Roseobacter sinensis]|uniref:Spermidine/putrescine import ATP-binding protein PotA n=1 Tax=Roseobacter sinensis TaxID=2931391 RepID=A0ABT3B987_9RHOB|nr:ABC transporter ATP-binding protein [Roseobacter sp. WL0113]MCV3270141.1 ABC transporter ATP-binding protein [Roseobacter sp. WL0113]
MDDQPAIRIADARKLYGSGEAAVRALDGVSLDILNGEFFTLLGPSGCGKTTLLRLIAGFETPTEGRIHIAGADVSDDPPNRRPVNTVFQSYALFPHMSVRRNIAFGLEMLGRQRGEIAETVERMIALVQLSDMAERTPTQLSGGQQQRVALARALAPKPKVLLLDEPLSALDLKLRKEMQLELKRLQHETGITFVFVTHDQEEALTMSDRIGVMRGGRLLQVGSPREIYNHPADRFVADFIGETNFLSARVEAEAVVLQNGARVPLASTRTPGSMVTLAVRPEQVQLRPDGPIAATVRQVVYSGTDTHCYAALSDGTQIVARLQNPPSGEVGLQAGEAIRIGFAEDAVQMLDD